jgi:hypothetical protein
MERTTEIPLTRSREVSEGREGILAFSSNRRKTAMRTPWYAAETISDAGKSEGPQSVGIRARHIMPRMVCLVCPFDELEGRLASRSILAGFNSRSVGNETESAQKRSGSFGRDRE